jgi:hypothetical protein
MLIEPKWKPLLKNTRHLTITSWPGMQNSIGQRAGPLVNKPGDQEYKWILMASLIAAIPYLQTIDFEAYEQLPLSIIEALAKHHPKAHLYVRNWTRKEGGQDHTDPAELALANCPNLRSIHTSDLRAFPFPRMPLNLRLPAFKRILALAPNLQEVEVSSFVNSNCTLYSTIMAGTVEQIHKTKLFAIDRPSTSIRKLKWQGIDFLFNLLDGIILDLSKIETLEFEQFVDPFPGINIHNVFWGLEVKPASLFPSLKHLSIIIQRLLEQTGRYEGIQDFITSLPRLESLSLSDWSHIPIHILLNILSIQGSTLRTLHFHDVLHTHDDGIDNPYPLGDAARMMTIDLLQDIRFFCPQLEEIWIDIQSSGDGSIERQLFSVLATFPKLKFIILTFDYGDGVAPKYRDHPRGRSAIPKSYVANPFQKVNPKFAENIWSVLREGKVNNNTTPLKRLEVMVGIQLREWNRSCGLSGAADMAINFRTYIVVIPRPGESTEKIEVTFRDNKTGHMVPDIKVIPKRAQKKPTMGRARASTKLPAQEN